MRGPVYPSATFLVLGITALALTPAWGATAVPPTVEVNVASDLTASSAHSDYFASQAPVEVHTAAAFQPAPMPNPDIDPPHGAASVEPSLAPAFFRHKEEFNGDGYAVDSDPDHGQDKRRTPAAGLNLSVPVK